MRQMACRGETAIVILGGHHHDIRTECLPELHDTFNRSRTVRRDWSNNRSPLHEQFRLSVFRAGFFRSRKRMCRDKLNPLRKFPSHLSDDVSFCTSAICECGATETIRGSLNDDLGN